jgi:hypothetical protein
MLSNEIVTFILFLAFEALTSFFFFFLFSPPLREVGGLFRTLAGGGVSAFGCYASPRVGLKLSVRGDLQPVPLLKRICNPLAVSISICDAMVGIVPFFCRITNP